ARTLSDSLRCCLAIAGIEPAWIDLLQVTGRVRYVIAQVVDHAFDCAAVEEVAVGVRQLGLEHPAHTPPGDSVGQGQRKDANDGREEVSERCSIQDVTN